MLAPSSALARFSFTVDVKAHPSAFKANTEVEVPLYLSENRAPDTDVSYFSRYPAGLREVYFDIGSVQSRFVSFTPADRFDGRGKNNPSAEGFEVYKNRIRDEGGRSRLYVALYATQGAPGTVDGSGITGRTEVLLGKLRIAVGAHGTATNGQKVVLDYTVGDDPSSVDPSFSWWSRVPDAAGKNWGVIGGTGITWPQQTRVFWDGKAENEGTAPGDGAGDVGGTGGGAGTGDASGTGSGAGAGQGDGAGAGGGAGAGSGAPGGGGTGGGASPGGAPGGGTGAGVPSAGPQAPGVSALGYRGRLAKAKRKNKQPFTVLTRAPKKSAPAVKVTVTGATSLTASLSKVAKNGTAAPLQGEKVFQVATLETYLQLTGSWNGKALPKGTYRLTLRSASGVAHTVGFKVG